MKEWLKKARKYTIIVANVVFLIVMLEVFGLKSLWLYLIFIIGMALFRLWKGGESSGI